MATKYYFFNTVTTISYAFSPVMNKSYSPPHCAHSAQKLSASVYECQWMQLFPHGGIQFHTFIPHTLPRQAPLCQTAPLLPSVTWQQNVKEYWWEDSASAAIPPPFASDGISQSEWKALLLEQPLYFCCSLLYTSANIRVFVSVPISTSTTIACVKTDLISRQRHVEISYPF